MTKSTWGSVAPSAALELQIEALTQKLAEVKRDEKQAARYEVQATKVRKVWEPRGYVLVLKAPIVATLVGDNEEALRPESHAMYCSAEKRRVCIKLACFDNGKAVDLHALLADPGYTYSRSQPSISRLLRSMFRHSMVRKAGNGSYVRADVGTATVVRSGTHRYDSYVSDIRRSEAISLACFKNGKEVDYNRLVADPGYRYSTSRGVVSQILRSLFEHGMVRSVGFGVYVKA